MSLKKKTIDIITGSSHIKKTVKKRLFDDLQLSYGKIIANAKEDGIGGINKANLSKYFSSDSPVSGSISQKSLLYLCVRYGINIRAIVKPMPYNEVEAKQRAVTMFGNK
jgi:hypothetical protein